MAATATLDLWFLIVQPIVLYWQLPITLPGHSFLLMLFRASFYCLEQKNSTFSVPENVFQAADPEGYGGRKCLKLIFSVKLDRKQVQISR